MIPHRLVNIIVEPFLIELEQRAEKAGNKYLKQIDDEDNVARNEVKL